MKPLLSALFILSFLVTALSAQDRITGSPDGDVSLKLEIERAIAKGASYLESQQNPETGSWSDPTLPALTALPISAIMGDPKRDPEATLPSLSLIHI